MKQARMPRVLYVAATNDEFELPLFVGDSATELNAWLSSQRSSAAAISALIQSKTGIAQTRDKRFKYFRMDSKTGKIFVGKLPPRVAKYCTSGRNRA